VRRLIVNADDYGLTPAVSRGIRHAHQAGIVTSTTAMMNSSLAAEALETAQRKCPGLGLGVHLVLSAGRPMLPPEAAPSIARLAGDGNFPRREALLEHADELDSREVEAEWRAQIEAFVAVVRRAPSHLDSHHHTSYYTPALFTVMLELAGEYGCAVRMPLTTLEAASAVLGSQGGLPKVAAGLSAIERMFDSAQAAAIRRPDHFESRFYGSTASAAHLNAILGGLPEGTTEIMCHPAFDDPALARLTSYNAPRVNELAALTQPGLRARLNAAGVELISFREL